MKIALVGSAPSSCRKAPFADHEWKIWGCSPGLYPVAQRIDAWFELHRWEPPVVGRADQQVPWFTPEYCAWMAGLTCPVWMTRPVSEIPSSRRLPQEILCGKYGHFFFTSSLSWMAALAIEAILEDRKGRTGQHEDMIGFWGVDMAATEEYGSQRAGCQFFATLAASMNINIVVPPESDLMTPPSLYGVSESNHRHIKLMARKSELVGRRAALENQKRQIDDNLNFLNGAIEDMDYHLTMWMHEGDVLGPRFEDMFNSSSLEKHAGPS